MNDIIRTTGRPMSLRLQRALGDLTGDDRRHAVTVLAASDSPILGAVHRAIALELQLASMVEQDVLDHLARDTAADVTDPPLPTAERGEPWWPDDAA